MELYDLPMQNADRLMALADVARIPLGGSIELIPLCNMSCSMCYIKHSKAEMDAEGRILSADEWLQIAEQAKEAGVLTLLLTGGEPLLYPEFEKLYIALMHMGIFISINTNGTLIDEHWADLFQKYVPRSINITLYGTSDKTYETLCHNPHGFSQVMRAVELLQERNIPYHFNCTITPENIDEIPEIREIARKNGVLLMTTSYVFPPVRRDTKNMDFHRILPEQVAKEQLSLSEEVKARPDYNQRVKNTLYTLNGIAHSEKNGYHCRAGRSGFWINWKGELTSCGMIPIDTQPLTEISFSEAWKRIVQLQSQLPVCEKCENCKKRNLCNVCQAACYTETGLISEAPEYLCRATDAKIRYLINELQNEEDKKEFEYLLESE